MKKLWFLLVVAACGGARPAPAPTKPVSPELSPALAPLDWWLGDWQSGAACNAAGPELAEHWVAASGAMYGVGFSDQGFEVMVVDDGEGEVADGVLRFIAMPQGARAVTFVQKDVGTRTVTFANPQHDDPKQITYARDDGGGLRAVLFGSQFIKIDFCAATGQPAPELEAADRAFSADTSARGVDGWVAAFDLQGGMLHRGERIEGAAIRDAMAGLLGKGKLVWDPIASRRYGTLGFTVGKATYTGDDTWQSSYVSIWRQQPDGSWKVLFDVGRPVQKPAP